MPCYCGAAECRKRMFWPSSLSKRFSLSWGSIHKNSILFFLWTRDRLTVNSRWRPYQGIHGYNLSTSTIPIWNATSSLYFLELLLSPRAKIVITRTVCKDSYARHAFWSAQEEYRNLMIPMLRRKKPTFVMLTKCQNSYTFKRCSILDIFFLYNSNFGQMPQWQVNTNSKCDEVKFDEIGDKTQVLFNCRIV